MKPNHNQACACSVHTELKTFPWAWQALEDLLSQHPLTCKTHVWAHKNRWILKKQPFEKEKEKENKGNFQTKTVMFAFWLLNTIVVMGTLESNRQADRHTAGGWRMNRKRKKDICKLIMFKQSILKHFCNIRKKKPELKWCLRLSVMPVHYNLWWFIRENSHGAGKLQSV